MTVAIDMLRQGNGRNFVILEKGHRVGGTWSDNEYPGACCDGMCYVPNVFTDVMANPLIVWSHLYSLSFEPNPEWTREYPTQPEIQRYLAGVARKYQLERNIRFGSEVEDCLFDPCSGLWSTHTRDGSMYTSRFLVSAVGQLNSPQLPDITGLGEFNGKTMHSARWDTSYDLTGKTVAVIGNGKLLVYESWSGIC
jgi:cation diffusion facilitator CzcD-associated flavoprotein CzcO